MQKKPKSSNITDINKIYLQNIVENLPEYIYWKNDQLIYQGCNKRVAEYLNLSSPQEIIGKSDFDFSWSAERIAGLHTVDKKILADGNTITVEDMIPRSDGSERIMLTTKSPLYDDNKKIIGILGVSADITELKMLERDLREAKEKAETALKDKEAAEAESREKSVYLESMLKEFKDKRYYLAGKYHGKYLTKREAECGLCLARGNTIKQIAKILNLSPRTVEDNLRKIKIKLQADNKADLILKLIECQFLDGLKLDLIAL